MRVDIELPVLLVEAARRLGTDLVAELQPLLCGEPGHRAGSVVVPLELTDKSIELPAQLGDAGELAVGLSGNQVVLVMPSLSVPIALAKLGTPRGWSIQELKRAERPHFRLTGPLTGPVTLSLMALGNIVIRPAVGERQ